MSREWSGVLAYADQRGRDAFTFEPITSLYLEIADDFVVRTPYSRTVVAELQGVPWARWDPVLKAWRVPFRYFEELWRHLPAIDAAARRAEPEERRRREESRKASPEHEDRRAEAAERRRHRYPPEDALPPLDRALMTYAGPVMFEAVTGELVEPMIAAGFYPDVTAGSAALIWAGWRKPSQAMPSWSRPGPHGRHLARPSWRVAGGSRRLRCCGRNVAGRLRWSVRGRRVGPKRRE